jgi:hypothetical protein
VLVCRSIEGGYTRPKSILPRRRAGNREAYPQPYWSCDSTLRAGRKTAAVGHTHDATRRKEQRCNACGRATVVNSAKKDQSE